MNFTILQRKAVWFGYLILCVDDQEQYSVWHTDTDDCRTGRFWPTYHNTLSQAQAEFESRTY